MSDLEQDLRDMLGRRADAAPATSGDWQDLTVRMARRNRHSRRLLAGTLAFVLIVGPLAGFAVARAVQESDPGGRVTAGGPSSDAAGNEIATANGMSRVAVGAYSTGTAGAFGITLEPLFRRTTGDGIAIRGFTGDFGDSGDSGWSNCDGNGWCPPPECFPDGVAVGQMSTEAAVGTAIGDHYSEITGALRVTANGSFGADGEGSPARWVIAQVGADVAKVQVEFEGGGHDDMAPVDGVVVLAAPSDPTKTGGTVLALDASGTERGRADVNATGFLTLAETAVSSTYERTTTSGDSTAAAEPGVSVQPDDPTVFISPGTSDACTPPPPPLPAPGEQPADPGAAKAEIERAFTLAYDGGLGGTEEQRAVVEDSDQLTAVMEKIRSGSLAQQVTDASAKVGEIVFTSPTEAAVRYDINIEDYTNFPNRVGRARLVDGRWLIARETVCQDIELAGGACPRG